MFKPAKKKASKAREKVDFKLEFHATRVPQRGWDKLLVSLISLETNKITAKTGKAPVKNGACLWSEPVYESALLLQDLVASNANKAPYKLLVSMGLSRFGILGEATIDLAEYMQAGVPVSLSLQLQNCSSGSILHVKIQRVGLNIASREIEDRREMQKDNLPPIFNVPEHCLDEISPGSIVTADKDDCTSTSCLSSDSVEAPHTPEVSESRPYGRESRGGELTSPCSSIGSCSGRQELGNKLQDYVGRFSEVDMANQSSSDDYASSGKDGSKCFSPLHSSRSTGKSDRPNRQFESTGAPPWTQMNDKEMEVVESTINELGVQSTLWEQRFKQMEVQKELHEKQHLEDMRRNEELQRALTSLKEERDSMKLEINSLRFAGSVHDRGGDAFDWRELRDELEYEKTVNSNLSVQLRKTQDSNSELLLEVQDLEKRLSKKGKKAMESGDDRGGDAFTCHELRDELAYEKTVNSNLALQLRKTQDSNSELLLEIQDLEKRLHEMGSKAMEPGDVLQHKDTDKDLQKMVDSLKKELEELERDSHELTEENMNLLSQLKQANENVKTKQDVIVQLELKMNNESYLCAEMETQKHKEEVDELRVKLRDCEESYESKLSSTRTLIDDLNSSVMMVRSKNARLERELQSSEGHISVLLNEIESLKSKIEGHEKERSLFMSQKSQLNVLREKASKAEQEHRGVLRRVEELEAINREVKAEKSRDLTAIKKQLQEFQEHALATDSKQRDTLNAMTILRDEKVNLEKDISTLRSAKESAEANVTQLQSFNMVLQEKLHLEQGKNAELVQDCKEKEAKNAQLCDELKASMTRLKVLEQTTMELETSAKEVEGKTGSLREENTVCRSRIKELELQLEMLEEEKPMFQSSRSEYEARLQEVQAFNEELSEKLRNAQEDIDWARENTNTLVNEIRELEGEIKSDMVVQQRLKQSMSELESEKLDWQKQLDELSNKNVRLEKDVLALEGRCQDALDEKDSCLFTLQEQKREQQSTEASLQNLIKQQEDKIQQLLASSSEHRIQQALLDASTLRDEKHALESELKQLQDMQLQAKKDVMDCEKKVKHAMLEASMRTDEKLELEGNVLKLEQMLKQAEKDAFSLKKNLDFQFQEATLKEQDMLKRLNKVTVEAQVLQDEKLELLQKIMALEAQCAAAELERRKLSMTMSKMENDLEVLQKEKEERERAFTGLKEEKETLKVSLGTVFKIESDLEVLQNEREVRERAIVSLNTEKERLEVSLRTVKQEMATLEERIESYVEASKLWEQSKTLLKESTDELDIMKEQNRELNLKLSEVHAEREELKQNVAFLEEELRRKAAVLASMELKMKENELFITSNSSPGSPLASCPSRAQNRSGALSSISSAREARSAESREKLKVLEGELKMKEAELELSRRQLKEQQAQISLKSKELEVAKQQLVKEQTSNVTTQLAEELTSLQNQNAALCQREIHLMSEIGSQEALQREIESLKKEKIVLERTLSNFSADANGDNLAKRLAALEMELAEVLEANSMYKKELQSAFAKQHNVHTAALEKLGSVEQVLQDLADLKRKNMILEDELKDMRQRYFNMSLQFAEVEAEREELVMTIRNLRGTKKLMPHKSVNF